MTAARFHYDRASGHLVGPGPSTPCRVRLEVASAIADRWRSRGYADAADALDAAAAAATAEVAR